ncbi:MAG: polysaccharide biosynthesis protein, partial [Acidimicrobiales bacterium]
MTGGQEAFLDEELLVGGMSGELQAASVPRAGEDRTEPTLTSGPRSAVVDFLDWIYNQPKYFPFTVDLMVWPVGLVVGALLKLVFDVGAAATELLGLITLAVVVHAVLGFATGLYRGRWRVASFTEASTVGVAWAGTSLVLAGTAFYTRLTLDSGLPTSAVISGCLASLVILMSERVVWRRYWETNLRPDPEHCQNTIVFGAGEGGSQIIRAMLLDPDSGYYPVALLDDDPKKRNREIEGVRVRGTRYDLPETAEATDAQILLVAVTHANSDMIADLAERAAAAGLELRVLPPASELVGRMTLADVRPPTVDDLLGRDPVEIDLEQVASYIRGRRVLVTGAGGSIGSELSKQIQGFGPAELFLLDRDENALHGVQLELEGRALLDSDLLVVADIRDRDRMFEIFDRCRPEVVFHAAALKHLTLLENHPGEGVKTNTFGTKNLLDAAVRVGVDRFVNVSTDKAADPTSVLGAT